MSLPKFIHESLDDILSEWERDCGDTPAVRGRRCGGSISARC